MNDKGPARFLLPSDVAHVLNISETQVYTLMRSGELRAIKLGARGQWRVEAAEVEAFIERQYARTAQLIANGRDGQD